MMGFLVGAVKILKAKDLQLMEKIIKAQVYTKMMIFKSSKKVIEVKVFQTIQMKFNKSK
jgi:hypothetical protein